MVRVHRGVHEVELSDRSHIGSALTPDAKRAAINRISYVQGHVCGVRRMIMNDEHCLDVLRQTYAIRRAVVRLEVLILEAQLRALVPTELAASHDEALGELLHLYELAGRRSHP